MPDLEKHTSQGPGVSSSLWVIDIFRRTLHKRIDSRPRVKEVSNYKDWGKLKGAVNQADTHRSCQ